MPVLVNPGGRFIIIDDPQQYEELQRSGFTVPPLEEENRFMRDYLEISQQYKNKYEPPPGIDVRIVTVSQGGKDGYAVSSGAFIDELIKQDVNIKTDFDNQRIGLLYHSPYSIMKMENDYKIIYTMFESDRIPDDWKPYLNEANKIIVPSKWCKQVFDNAGYDVEVVPLGYNHHVYTYQERPERDEFTFLHYNAFDVRKGFMELFEAFNAEFSNDEPVKLILKARVDHVPLPIIPSQYPNIEVINGSYDEKEMIDLMKRSDCFVFPSRGEGFGITPLEAMATGLPAIIPNAHGLTEYFDPEFMYEVKVAGNTPATYYRYKNQNVGSMKMCDVADLRKQMRYVYEHREEAKKKGQKAAEYVKQWTFENTATKLKSIFTDIYSKPYTKKAVGNVLSLKAI